VSPPASPQQIGTYDLLAKIAEGGMGAVHKARSRITGQIVAIKIVPAETARNPVLLKRFEQEFRAASLLDHPNVVKAIEYNGASSTPFLVMEFVDGLSLGRKVEREGALPEDLALHILAQVCDGLHRAHKQGLIHRDVKPDNILVTADGVAKLTDLGLVKEVEGDLNLTKTGRGLGTPHFMAPEQFRNAKNADVRCDIYSLGATLYMMLTGVVPFAKTSPLDCWMKKIKNDFPPPRKLSPGISDRVNWATLRAMSADPAQRPASCRELLEDLTGQAWQGWSPAPKVDDALPDSSSPSTKSKPIDLWYLVYKNADGVQQKVKGTTDSIRQNVKAKMLGDTSGIVVCRNKQGPFVPLKNVPEFRDMVVAAASVDAAKAAGKSPRAPVGPTAASVPIPTSAVDTVKSMKTAPQTHKGTKRAADPQADVPTQKHDVLPVGAKASAVHIPVKPTPRKSTLDYLPWLLIALAITAAAVGIILFTRD
jgi:serine/threonine protein kinase